MLGGGEVAGLLRFNNTDLAEGRNLLGRMAVAISESMNSQHRLGLTLDGQVGGNLFTPIALADARGASTSGSGATTDWPCPTPRGWPHRTTRSLHGGQRGQVVRLSDGKVFNSARRCRRQATPASTPCLPTRGWR
jgi:flagellar hook-associated protein 1 FlgK